MLASPEPDEAPDDPLWVGEEGEQDDIPFPSSAKKKKTSKNLSKAEKVSKCPHCFREFTNLKHHINQQHAQVRLQRVH